MFSFFYICNNKAHKNWANYSANNSIKQSIIHSESKSNIYDFTVCGVVQRYGYIIRFPLTLPVDSCITCVSEDMNQWKVTL